MTEDIVPSTSLHLAKGALPELGDEFEVLLRGLGCHGLHVLRHGAEREGGGRGARFIGLCH